MSETTTYPAPQPNVALLRKMVEWVEEQEPRTENREWFQGSWITSGLSLEYNAVNFCDTACCVAGKVAIIEGYQPETLVSGEYTGEVIDPKTGITHTKTGITHTTEIVARKALGLTESEGMTLFNASNTAADIRRIAEELAGERL